MKIGTKISLHRKKAGYSQEELAAKLNISRQAISRWETGEAIPDTEKIVLLSTLFGVSTDYLLLEEIEDWQEGEKTTSESTKQSTPKHQFRSRRNCGIGILVIGVVCILTTIILAGVHSETMTEWITDCGAFGTALFHTWRVVFLYLGVVLVAVSFWLLLDLGRRIKQFPHKRKLVIPTALLLVICLYIVGHSLFSNGTSSIAFSIIPVLLFVVFAIVLTIVKSKGE